MCSDKARQPANFEEWLAQHRSQPTRMQRLARWLSQKAAKRAETAGGEA